MTENISEPRMCRFRPRCAPAISSLFPARCRSARTARSSPGGIEAQTRQAMANVEAALRLAGRGTGRCRQDDGHPCRRARFRRLQQGLCRLFPAKPAGAHDDGGAADDRHPRRDRGGRLQAADFPETASMRIFTASLATETNTFSPVPTDRASFEAAFYAPPGQHPPTPTLCSSPIVVATPARGRGGLHADRRHGGLGGARRTAATQGL